MSCTPADAYRARIVELVTKAEVCIGRIATQSLDDVEYRELVDELNGHAVALRGLRVAIDTL